MMDKTIDVASTCVGTPCYLSPEMCQDIPYTSKADVWVRLCQFIIIIIYRQLFYYTTIRCNFSMIILHFLILLGFQALGCLFYEIIALKPAFDANNLISLFYKIVKGDFDVSIVLGTSNTNIPRGQNLQTFV